MRDMKQYVYHQSSRPILVGGEVIHHWGNPTGGQAHYISCSMEGEESSSAADFIAIGGAYAKDNTSYRYVLRNVSAEIDSFRLPMWLDSYDYCALEYEACNGTDHTLDMVSQLYLELTTTFLGKG